MIKISNFEKNLPPIYGAYPCTGAHCEVVGRCCVVWVDVGRCSAEGRVAEAMEVVVYAWFVVVVATECV